MLYSKVLFWDIPTIVIAIRFMWEDAKINRSNTNKRPAIPRKLIISAALSFFFCCSGYADSLDMPTDIGANKNASRINVPSRGMTKEQVDQQFGQPRQKIRAVGDPPISRWIYSEFTVHFESEFVIHSVTKK